MATVVRGPASSRSKTAPAARLSAAKAQRTKVSDRKGSRPPPARGRGGLGPRLAVGVGIVVLVGAALAAAILARADRSQAGATESPIGRLTAPLGFTLERVDVQGAPDMAMADILRAAALTKGAPILDLNLEALRKRVEAAGWTEDVKVVRLLPDTLIIAVVPRPPAAVWQHQGVSRVIDHEGRPIGGADPARFPDLPLVVGDGAAEQAGAILSQLHKRSRLAGRIDALIRVDGRRWDLRLKDGALIQLPALGVDAALDRLDELDQKQRLLSLGFERVDLRDPEAIAVRPRAATDQAGAAEN